MKRYEIPDNIPGLKNLYNDIKIPEDLEGKEEYYYEVQKKPFCIQVFRKQTQEEIFSTCDNQLIFSDLYLEITTILPTKYIFGLGERNPTSLRLKKGQYTLYARDDPSILENNQLGNNVYGSHPMYLVKEKSGKFNVVFFKYSGAIDVINQETSLTFKSIGGIFNFKIFFGDKNPETAIKLYHQYLGGGYTNTPFWAFGSHQSRWGYKDSKKLIQVVKDYHDLHLPLDTIWSDIDHMIDKQTFSVNQELFKYEDYQYLQNQLNVSFVPIVDVAVGNTKYPKDEALLFGKQLDIFCYSPNTGRYFKGEVWPGNSWFPDFFHPQIGQFWSKMLKSLHQKTNYTGIWLDMNEPANFCHGECKYRHDFPKNQKSQYLHKKIDFPYTIGGGRKYINLDYKSLPTNLIHYGNYTHKDVHNLYGLLDMYHTHSTLKNQLNQKIPFVLSRSTFAGAGKYGQHWCGDNHSDWAFLKSSIPLIMQFNMFGIPFTGCDVCGFMGDTKKDLCQRWIQAATLQPFFRNHNNDQAQDQEFYSLGQEVYETARKNLRLRYSLLKFYFTAFIRNKGKGTVFRPLFFEFYNDIHTYEDIVMNEQYLIGKELMVTPVLYKNEDTANPYFPEIWNDFLSGQKYEQGWHTIKNNLTDFAPIFIRQGCLVQFQSNLALTTKQIDNSFSLVTSLVQGNKYRFKYDIFCYSEGNILNIEDYNNDDQVIKQCEGENNCIINVIVGLTFDKQLKVILEPPHQDTIIVNNLQIHSLYLYNVPVHYNINLENYRIELGPYPNNYFVDTGDWDIQNNGNYYVMSLK
ncbi:Glycoside hydrolase, superfamily [Pseudocohnilembus persalinus]|uniref:Glycoside hydrolase, superfamily n=1 Tax=Pseudocohnilembus persalinus TaxID=266149 RepID=A0A0V0QJ21_PSEPJ|nr:Glycoside hydrolase, superfamily [Pseudocohnilembus persalinus]|eukprot:KRX02139.1 Glycoside hydrolase, superfamily [Pseudocohnilembus persalinus]